MGECAGVVKPFLSGRQTRKHWIKASPRASLLLYLLHRDQLVCMNVHIHEKYKSKGTRCRNTAPQSSVAIHLLSLCHSPSVEPIWFIISWMEQFAFAPAAVQEETSPPLLFILSGLTFTAVAMATSTCQLRQALQQARQSDWSIASWQVQVEWSARQPKCSAGSSDRLTDSWFRNSWGWGSAAPNWRGSCRFWLTGVIMDSGRAADTPAVILNSKYLANFFSAFLFLLSSRLWSSSGTLFGSAAHSPCV